MTKREAAIVSAYTGYLCGSFAELQAYVEHLMGRPVWTHQMGDKQFADEIQAKAKPDFIGITVE